MPYTAIEGGTEAALLSFVKRFRIFIIFTVCLAVLTTHAETRESCTEKNLIGSSWSPLPQIQIPNTCYANVAASLLSNELNAPVSIVAVANYAERSENKFHDAYRSILYGPREAYKSRFSYFGGDLANAIDVSLNTKLCRRSFLDHYNGNIEHVFVELEKAREKSTQEFIKKSKQSFDSEALGFAEKLVTASSRYTAIIDTAVDLLCIQLDQNTPLKRKNLYIARMAPEVSELKIDEILSAGNAIGIGYNARVIAKNGYPDAEKANHASTLVGQTWNSKTMTCNYLVRFTDLETCKYISQDFACSNGILSIPKLELIGSTAVLVWIEK